MDDKDLLELAAQAGICYIDSDDGAAYASVREDVDMSQYILAFARLVAAAEREACANAAISSIQDCHREQGAANNGRSSDMAFGYVSGAEAAAEAIRGK